MAAAYVDITLDKSRRLIFDMEAMELLEGGLNGLPLRDVIDRIRGVSLHTLCVAMWAGLKSDDKTLTLSLTKKIVKKAIFDEGRAYTDLSELVAEALEKSGIFGAKDVEPEPGNATAATTAST